MDLREELAARLKAVTNVQPRERAQAREVFEQHFSLLADECIRQMEWARRIGYRHAELAAEDADYVLKANAPPLTLAPKDWKP